MLKETGVILLSIVTVVYGYLITCGCARCQNMCFYWGEIRPCPMPIGSFYVPLKGDNTITCNSSSNLLIFAFEFWWKVAWFDQHIFTSAKQKMLINAGCKIVIIFHVEQSHNAFHVFHISTSAQLSVYLDHNEDRKTDLSIVDLQVMTFKQNIMW